MDNKGWALNVSLETLGSINKRVRFAGFGLKDLEEQLEGKIKKYIMGIGADLLKET